MLRATYCGPYHLPCISNALPASGLNTFDDWSASYYERVALIASVGTMMGNANTNPDPCESAIMLVTNGPFRFSGNPHYLSVTIIHLGISISVNTLWLIVLLMGFLLVITYGVIKREERYLERKLSEDYIFYKARV